MTEKRFKEYMTLFAKLTGWGDQSLSVSVGFKRARQFTAPDASHLSDTDWGFVASTTTLQDGNSKISGQGPSLEEAFANLADNIVERLGSASTRAHNTARAANAALDEFLMRSQ